ncbi:MAG: transcription-repair coupling factor [Candidatus Zixiibacteriota bacterium]|nr:MAG: transcription-repair coupling factor [candidate division Zixibacteria bacterium]
MKLESKQRTRKLDQIFDRWSVYPPFVDLCQRLNKEDRSSIPVAGLSGSSSAFLLKGLVSSGFGPVLVVTRDAESAGDLYDDLAFILGEDSVGHFPARQVLPYDFRAPLGEIMGKRISTLASLLEKSISVVVCPLRALMEPTITVNELKSSSINLKTGQEADMGMLAERLLELGFRRVPIVEEVGDFALRGGLFDFFSPGSVAPVRVEFYGDEIDTIRKFEVATQRTIERIDSVSLLPKREIPVTQETLEQHLEVMPEEDSDYVRRRYLNDPELPGLEWLAVAFGIAQGCLLDYFDREGILFLDGEPALRTEADAVMEEAAGLYARFRERLSTMPTPEQYYQPVEGLFESLQGYKRINRTVFRGGRAGVVDFACQPHPAFGSRIDQLGTAIKEYHAHGLTYLVASDSEGQAERLRALLSERAEIENDLNIEVADLKGGFVCPAGGFVILTDHEIFSRYHRRIRRKKFKEGVAISDYSSLSRGDFVVHTDYGIARYLGLETLQVDGRNRDCLLLLYAENDRLYIPIEEFNRVSKYSGKDAAPQLTRLGGPGWEKLKKKTKKAITDMAADLIKLYAERKAKAGFSFGEDTVWLKQLEASFVYEETPDQLKAIYDVKKDMTGEEPMDRLVCGDVGYGKTEVAVRAAFKAAEQGKQVAVLVPTTILAQQHLHTFCERLTEFPVRVEMLSRFRTRKEQLKIVEELAQGKVDLVIGTHRLLSKDIHFRDLGLLIVDEEHRFGVRHKEKLRQMKTDVDTISMTATPIPRTLQMSLMGARDMSLITTSPKDRLPIITEIAEFDPATIATTILREVDRGGQVFFVHNRVQTIDAMYNYLKRVVPRAEIAVAHGQMHEKSLEGIMLAFLAGRYNVLLCTSIIESGLDIPNANTIIINRADRFGLAQLYQLRGRVGRSARRAYAYLLTPPTRLLRADAIKRLRAIEAHSDLGSGFALAMRDLEIRGAGTILGPRQSGFIEEVGFDLYNRLLEEAVCELKGQEIKRPPQTKLESDIEMFLPNEYINNRQQKVDIYRRLADCRTLEEVEQMREEIFDRFGRMPQSAMDLFDGTAAKIAASLLEIEKVKIRQGVVNLFFEEGRKLKRSEVEALGKATDCPMEFSLTGNAQIIIDMTKVDKDRRLSYLRGLLGKL